MTILPCGHLAGAPRDVERPGHRLGGPERRALDAAALRRPATVMRNGRGIGNRDDHDATGLQRANGHFPSRAWSLDEDVNLSQTMLLRPASCALGSHLGSEGRALARALEAVGTSARPGNHVAGRIGERNDGVIECRLDVGSSAGDVLAIPTTNPTLLSIPSTLVFHCASLPPTTWISQGLENSRPISCTNYFLRPPMARFGPRRVRALVRVRCPRTGMPRRWRSPRYEPISTSRLMFIATSRR